MTLFWLSSVIVLCGAVLALLFPFFRASKAPVAQITAVDAETARKRAEENVKNFQERLTELQRELDAGALTPEDFQTIKTEMEQVLYDDAFSLPPQSGHQVSTALPKVLLGGLVLALIGLSYGLYFRIGAYDKVVDMQTAGTVATPAMHGADPALEKAVANRDMSALVEQLHTKLQAMPDNLEGWMLLARSAMNIARYDLAEAGYRQVITLVEREGKPTAPFHGLLAQTLYFKNPGAITPDVQQALDKALALDSEEVNSLALLAMHNFELGQFEEAIQYWHRILKADPQHPSREMIEQGIAQAQAQLGQSGASSVITSNEPAQTEPVTQAMVQVRVSLADGAAQGLSPDTTLFIFARAPSGPPMPVAASRHTLSELPLTLTLSDANAMGPMAKLSQFERVDLVARISLSGQPTAQPGDLEASAKDIRVGQSEVVELVIRQ